MPVVDVPTQNAILDGWLGTTRGSTAADSYVVRLWQDDPRQVGAAEADWGGYTPPTWSSDDWLAADGGEKLSDGSADFDNPTGAGTDAARYWALHDATTDALCYSAPLATPINVSAASAASVRIRMTVPYAT